MLVGLLARLARYGDRIAVRLPEGWQRALAVDSSVFELVLGEKRGRRISSTAAERPPARRPA